MNKIIALTIILILVGCSNMSDKEIISIEEGREFLNKADYEKAAEIAQANINTDKGKHLQGDLYFLQGKYREADEIYGKIDSNYEQVQRVLNNLASVNIHHLKDIGEAKKFASLIENETTSTVIINAIENPMTVESSGTFEVPMITDDPLYPYIPSISGKINGQDQVLTFDTGGNYILMTAKAAEELGIEYDKDRHVGGRQGAGTATIWAGVADSVTLGDDLTLNNVPVMILSEINVPLVFFGTNILKESLSTIDYPKEKFVFTTKDGEIQDHLEKYDGNKMDFVMWDDHYMMGKGKYNDKDVNMFFDSGLVVVGEIEGEVAQAWLTINEENAALLGIEEELESMQVTKTDDTLEFAGNINDNALVILSDSDFKFNDVKCDFLVSHGIIKKYAWTIDFENMVYMFKE